MKTGKCVKRRPQMDKNRAVQDEIFNPDDNLYCIPEGQSSSVCHPLKYKNQINIKKCEKDSFDEI